MLELRMAHESEFEKAATTIQCFWRLSKAQSDYGAVIRSTTRIQSCWRGYKALTDYACLIYGVVCLQAKFRQRHAMIDYIGMRQIRHSVIILQAVVRSWFVEYK